PPSHRSTLFPYTTLFRSHIGILKAFNLSAIIHDHPDACLPGYWISFFNLLIGIAVHFGHGFGVALRNGWRIIKVSNGCLPGMNRSEEHTSELQSRFDLVC